MLHKAIVLALLVFAFLAMAIARDDDDDNEVEKTCPHHLQKVYDTICSGYEASKPCLHLAKWIARRVKFCTPSTSRAPPPTTTTPSPAPPMPSTTNPDTTPIGPS